MDYLTRTAVSTGIRTGIGIGNSDIRKDASALESLYEVPVEVLGKRCTSYSSKGNARLTRGFWRVVVEALAGIIIEPYDPCTCVPKYIQ